MEIRSKGERNQIHVAESVQGVLEVRGSDNVVSIDEPLASRSVRISIGSGNTIKIGRGCVLGQLFIHANDGATIDIGVGVGFNGYVRLLAHEARRISIGDGCLFAGQTDVTVSDMHSIVEIKNGRRINPARDVAIGNRVWIGARCLVLKGATIEEGSVIGAASVVTKRIPANALAVGVPAVVKRTGITWRNELVPDHPTHDG